VIFAELEYQQHYSDIHNELAAFIGRNFSDVESGLQGDSWIQILDGGEKVQVDTFTSMKHQIKSSKASHQVQRVIELLARRYKLRLYEPPELEGHEG
jgi:23S rRNA G2445 N2-methylase RlmL